MLLIQSNVLLGRQKVCHGGRHICLCPKHEMAAQVSSRHPEAKGKAWIFKKKEQARRKGYVGIPIDSKYTGRKRKSRF